MPEDTRPAARPGAPAKRIVSRRNQMSGASSNSAEVTGTRVGWMKSAGGRAIAVVWPGPADKAIPRAPW